jgi:hypothetical protein
MQSKTKKGPTSRSILYQTVSLNKTTVKALTTASKNLKVTSSILVETLIRYYETDTEFRATVQARAKADYVEKRGRIKRSPDVTAKLRSLSDDDIRKLLNLEN